MVLSIALFMYACMYSMTVVNVHDQVCVHSNYDVDSLMALQEADI